MDRLPRRLVVGPGLLLRIPTLEDAADLLAAVDANRNHLREWLHWVDEFTSVDDMRPDVTWRLRQADEGTAMRYVIERDGQIVGHLGVTRLNSPDNLAELSYWLAAKVRGSGIMTRCCRTVIDYLFSRCGKNRVEIRTAATNRRSRALAERLGFIQEGTLRQATRRLGTYHHAAIYSVLASEWSKNSAFPEA